MKNSFLVLLLSLLLGSSVALADDNHAADRQQLLTIMNDIERGINESKIDLMTQHLDQRATVTWLNAEVSTGPAEVSAYFKRMVGTDAGAVLSKYTTHPKISQPARFYGGTAIANGTTEDEFTPHHRRPFTFHTLWTASLLKQGDQWKIVSLNLSTNTFNNALISELERYTVLAGIGGCLGGILIATLWVYLRRRGTKR